MGYAIGYKADEVVVIPVGETRDDEIVLDGEILVFTKDDTVKFNLSKEIVLKNSSKKLKLNVSPMLSKTIARCYIDLIQYKDEELDTQTDVVDYGDSFDSAHFVDFIKKFNK